MVTAASAPEYDQNALTGKKQEAVEACPSGSITAYMKEGEVMTEAIVHGIILAFGLILPLGVQNIFVFNQGAQHARFRSVLPVVLTAAACDTLLITAAVGGISLVILSLDWVTPLIYSAGILFLCFMGWRIWRSSPAQEEAGRLSPKGQMLYALSVSLLNPHALLDTVGVIGTSSLQYDGMVRWAFAAATVAVSWIWFLGLAAAGRLLGRMDASGKVIKRLNTASALLIWAIAVYMGIQLWRSF
jgi:L-lysine exporter family protein LysE/ArgO